MHGTSHIYIYMKLTAPYIHINVQPAWGGFGVAVGPPFRGPPPGEPENRSLPFRFALEAIFAWDVSQKRAGKQGALQQRG